MILILGNAKKANDINAPEQSYRYVVEGMTVAMLVTFCLLLLIGLWEVWHMAYALLLLASSDVSLISIV